MTSMTGRHLEMEYFQDIISNYIQVLRNLSMISVFILVERLIRNELIESWN